MMMEDAEKTKGGSNQILICPECLAQYEPGLLVCPLDQSPLKNLRVEQEDTLVGQTIDGRWLIKRKLGAGGMGMVYLAHQLNIERRVAVKTMQRGLESGHEFMERFLREANVASQVSHPHLVSIHDFGQTEEGLLYIVMEYLDGETLAERMRRDRLTLAQTIKIAMQLCAALTAAHGVGIVHRDLKPDNIFLLYMPGDEIFVKLLDFGIAKHMNSHAMTQTGQVFGTPDYMSPEQCRGKSDIDHRSDLYALGCILYELMSGRTPFHSESMLQVLFKHVSEDVPPLQLNVPVEDEALERFEEIVLKLLEKRRKARYHSAHLLREELEALLQDLTQRDLLQPAWSSLSRDGDEQFDTARLGEGTQEDLELLMLDELQGVGLEESEAEEAERADTLPFVDTRDELPSLRSIEAVDVPSSSPGTSRKGASRYLLVLIALALLVTGTAVFYKGQGDATSAANPPEPVAAPAVVAAEVSPDLSLSMESIGPPAEDAGLAENSLQGAIVESARLVIHAVAYRRAEEALQLAQQEHMRTVKKSEVTRDARPPSRKAPEDESLNALLDVRTRTSMKMRIDRASLVAQRCPGERMQAAPALYSSLVGESIKIEVFFDIAPSGEVSNISARQSTGKSVDDAALFSCIKRPYEKLKFNPQTGVLQRVERQGAQIVFSLRQSE